MVVLGLILVLVAVVAGVVLVVENSGSDHVVSLSVFGGAWRVDAYWLAVVGAAILLVAVLGLALMRAGGKRGLRRRQERKQLKRENAALADRVRHEERSVAAPSRREEHAAAAEARHEAAPDPLVKRDEPTYEGSPTGAR